MSATAPARRRPREHRKPSPATTAGRVLEQVLPVGEWVTPHAAVEYVVMAHLPRVSVDVDELTITTPAGEARVVAGLRWLRSRGRMKTRWPEGEARDDSNTEHLLLPRK